MANIKSQKKRIRQDKTKNIRNKAAKTSLKSSLKSIYDEENNLVSEVVTENLSTPNIFILFIAILSATIASDKKIFHE